MSVACSVDTNSASVYYVLEVRAKLAIQKKNAEKVVWSTDCTNREVVPVNRDDSSDYSKKVCFYFERNDRK